MSKDVTVSFPDEISHAIEKAAEAQGKTPEEWVVEAAKRDLGRQFFARIQREAEIRRGNKTDEEVEEIVEKAIQEYRNENRSR